MGQGLFAKKTTYLPVNVTYIIWPLFPADMWFFCEEALSHTPRELKSFSLVPFFYTTRIGSHFPLSHSFTSLENRKIPTYLLHIISYFYIPGGHFSTCPLFFHRHDFPSKKESGPTTGRQRLLHFAPPQHHSKIIYIRVVVVSIYVYVYYTVLIMSRIARQHIVYISCL